MIRNFLVALQFLTTIPIRIKAELSDQNFAKSLLYFPLVGLLVGLFLCIPFLFSRDSFAIAIISSITIVMSLFITGAVHVDGLADTCDGFFSQQSKSRMLEIMKDSRVGTMGATAIAADFLLKFSLLSSVNNYAGIILMVTFSRWAQVVGCYMSTYPRPDGTGSVFIGKAAAKHLIAGGIFVFVLFILLSGLKGMIIMGLSLLPVVGFIIYCHKKIGGMTGDNIGALNEIAEIAVLFVFYLLQ